MSTAASILADVLEGVSRIEENGDLLIVAVAKERGLFGEGGKLLALSRLYELSEEVHRQIDHLPHDETSKNLARTYMDPLVGFRNFSSFGHAVQQVRNPLLHPTTIANLRVLHMILAPYSKHADVLVETKGEIEKLRDLLKDIQNLAIPAELKSAIQFRLLQVLDAMDHFDFLGETHLANKIDALVGKLAVSATQKDLTVAKVFRGIVVSCGLIASALITTKEAAEAYLSLTISLPEIAGLLPPPDEQSLD